MSFHAALAGIGTQAALGIATVLGIVASYLVGYWFGMSRGSDSVEFEPIEGLEDNAGFTTYEGDGAKGLLGTYFAQKKKRSVLKDGMVRWHLVGSSLSEPMYVSPELKGGGNVPELDYEEETYLFPKGSAVPSEEEGVPTFVHREGEADPMDLRNDWDLALNSKSLSEYLTVRVTSKSPTGMGMLSDLDTMDYVRYGIIGIVGLFILVEMMG